MAPEMAVHVNAMVLLALASMAVKLHFRSLPKSRNPNCGSVARVKLSTVFLVQVVRLFSLQPKSLRRNVNGIPWFHWSMIHGFVHISRSILYGYFYPLVFWYQWEYLLTSKEFSFLQGTWDWQWFFPLLHGHHDKNRAPVVSFDMCPGQGPQGPCGSRDFNRHLWPQTVCLEGWCQLLVVSNISISDIP